MTDPVPTVTHEADTVRSMNGLVVASPRAATASSGPEVIPAAKTF
jgi:hypothetical protein